MAGRRLRRRPRWSVWSPTSCAARATDGARWSSDPRSSTAGAAASGPGGLAPRSRSHPSGIILAAGLLDAVERFGADYGIAHSSRATRRCPVGWSCPGWTATSSASSRTIRRPSPRWRWVGWTAPLGIAGTALARRRLESCGRSRRRPWRGAGWELRAESEPGRATASWGACPSIRSRAGVAEPRASSSRGVIRGTSFAADGEDQAVPVRAES